MSHANSVSQFMDQHSDDARFIVMLMADFILPRREWWEGPFFLNSNQSETVAWLITNMMSNNLLQIINILNDNDGIVNMLDLIFTNDF